MSEQIIWQGHPSQILNLWWFIFMAILAVGLLAAELFPLAILPLLVAFWQWLVIKTTQYELTSQRLKTKRGVLNRRIDELELYRIKDYAMEQPLFLRLFGLGNVILHTSDRTDPLVVLRAIRDGEKLRDTIRGQVEARRAEKGVRETDFVQ